MLIKTICRRQDVQSTVRAADLLPHQCEQVHEREQQPLRCASSSLAHSPFISSLTRPRDRDQQITVDQQKRRTND